ncbi:MAG: DUF6600 domain-containing protein [Thermoanaerobaculia bacterium]
MKTTRIMLLAAVLLGTLPATGSAVTSVSAGLHIGPSGHTSVDVGFFYDDLASYGHWIQRPRYGWVWTPRVAVRTWRPYEYGHWVWTDLGWTWVSDEPFGWATYHYGRWYDDPDYGWGWVPGDQWAPAWVDWQASDDYVGWAPLPPAYDYRPGVLVNLDIAPVDFVFVPAGRFLDTRLVNYAVPSWQCAQIYRGTRSFTRYQNFNNRVFNAGFPVDRVQRWTGRPVQRFQVADLGWNQRHQERIARNQVAMFRPQVQRARVADPLSRPIARRAVLAGAAATAVVAAHHAFRAEQARHQPQGVVRQPERMNRQALAQQKQQARVQERLRGQQQRQVQQQARIQQREGRAQRQAQVQQQQQARQQQRFQRQQQQQRAHVQQQQARIERQNQGRQQMQARQLERSQRQQQQQARQQARVQQQQARVQQQEARAQRQVQMRQQQQARQQERFQRQARVQQQRPPQRQFQQAQAQRQQPRPQRQGNPGQQGQGNNHHRQRPPQQ